ncbi:MAG TPA: HEAT repeat domain-containing protein [Oscillatoriaceae cyanobacterium M33_DOE_052]|uniref:HEAT repeat domain-containing protein n=1 Tax=Planktothricoides sp. SpSt-374 TaxID=2282167 RepID=A0A7C3ZM58_9CYAN|nr:HEAT repeat domain-containing protein [Oscillatoriaceae cyanobacterium M33_DOE_052]
MNQSPVLELIAAVDQADSAPKLVAAVWQLANVRSETAIPKLITALGYNNPGAAVAAVEGLVALGSAAVPALLEHLDGYNYGARAWALRALAGIGDPRSLALLGQTAESDFALSVRRAAARGLGNIRWSDMAAATIPAAQEKAMQSLLKASTDPEWVVRYAAVVGLQGLGVAMRQHQHHGSLAIDDRLQEMAANDAELAVRARALLAAQELNRNSQDV